MSVAFPVLSKNQAGFHFGSQLLAGLFVSFYTKVVYVCTIAIPFRGSKLSQTTSPTTIQRSLSNIESEEKRSK